MLEVSALACMRGEREIFQDLNFCVRAGEWLHVRGENGAGKTTLLRSLCGLLRPTRGTVNWQGQSIHTLGEAFHRDLAYVGHATGLKDELSAEENLRVACASAGLQAARPPAAALQALGIDPRGNAPVRAFSQGQKRRVALARLALVTARLWILDEPLAALDAPAIERVTGLIEEHLARQGVVVFSSHQPLALAAAGSEILLRTGREPLH